MSLQESKQTILNSVVAYHKDQFNESTFMPGVTKINYAGRVYDEQELVNLVDASLDFWLTSGKWTKKFEYDLAKFLDIKHCLFVNSGSSANLLAFMALTSSLLGDRRINRGDEVITVAACFPTTISPILQYGAVPVFVDIEPDTLNIDCSLLNKAFSSKTKAVILAHTLGSPFNIAKVRRFCNDNNLWFIEDNCDSLGSKYEGQYTGTFGDIGTSSFYPPHHITTGEGGAVYTNNDLLHKIMKSMRDWGRDCECDSGVDDLCKKRFLKQYGNLPFGYDHKYVYSHFGYNLKATDLQAAIGCAQLEKLPLFINKRIGNRNYLFNHLQNIDAIKIQDYLPNTMPSWFGFFITVHPDKYNNRYSIVAYLESKGIQTRMLFAGNITKHPCFDSLIKNTDYKIVGDLDNTNKIMNDGFWIGVYPGMTIEKMDYMIETIKEILI